MSDIGSVADPYVEFPFDVTTQVQWKTGGPVVIVEGTAISNTKALDGINAGDFIGSFGQYASGATIPMQGAFPNPLGIAANWRVNPTRKPGDPLDPDPHGALGTTIGTVALRTSVAITPFSGGGFLLVGDRSLEDPLSGFANQRAYILDPRQAIFPNVWQIAQGAQPFYGNDFDLFSVAWTAQFNAPPEDGDASITGHGTGDGSNLAPQPGSPYHCFGTTVNITVIAKRFFVIVSPYLINMTKTKDTATDPNNPVDNSVATVSVYQPPIDPNPLVSGLPAVSAFPATVITAYPGDGSATFTVAADYSNVTCNKPPLWSFSVPPVPYTAAGNTELARFNASGQIPGPPFA